MLHLFPGYIPLFQVPNFMNSFLFPACSTQCDLLESCCEKPASMNLKVKDSPPKKKKKKEKKLDYFPNYNKVKIAHWNNKCLHNFFTDQY